MFDKNFIKNELNKLIGRRLVITWEDQDHCFLRKEEGTLVSFTLEGNKLTIGQHALLFKTKDDVLYRRRDEQKIWVFDLDLGGSKFSSNGAFVITILNYSSEKSEHVKITAS